MHLDAVKYVSKSVTMNQSKSKKSGAYHHGDLKSALIRSAIEIVEEGGLDQLSLRGVAKHAGVSRAAPYHHFANKQEMLAAVAAAGFRSLTANMLEKADGYADPREKLDRLGFGYVDFSVNRSDLFRLMQGPEFQVPGIYPDLDTARAASAGLLMNAVSDCLANASKDKIHAAASAAWSIVHGMTLLVIDGRMATVVSVDDLEDAAMSITQHLNLNGQKT
jgi:AcrR family transcriptional regulator